MPNAPRQHALPNQPRKEKRCPKVDLEHPIQLLDRVVRQLPNAGHPSAGDKHVNVRTGLNHPKKIAAVGKISDNPKPPDFLGKIVKNVAPPPSQREGAPLIPQPPNNGLPQRPGSPSNQHTPPTKFHGRMVVAPTFR